MTAKRKSEFDWDKLLKDIFKKDVIPVIGEHLYRVDIASESKKNYPLYEYLACVVSGWCKKIPCGGINKFPGACEQFLEENDNDYENLSRLLNDLFQAKDKFQNIELIKDNPLEKLAMIKSFNAFLTTTYDDFLSQTLNRLRSTPTVQICYTKHEKKHLNRLGEKNSGDSLLIQLFGNFDSVTPAYTEQSKMQTIVEFYDDIYMYNPDSLYYPKTSSNSSFHHKLSSSNLLFLGCEYDDCLVRFLICLMSSRANRNQNFKVFIGDDFRVNLHAHQTCQLLRALREHDALVFYPNKNGNFIDLLFEKMSVKYPAEIIHPLQVFISFERDDREVAQKLANQLEKDGIRVWFDKYNLEGGDDVKEEIITAIDQSSVFLPLSSIHTLQKTDEKGDLRYHIKEWEYAHSKYIKLKDKKIFKIIPVVLDKPINILKEFQGLVGYVIPNGPDGEYGNLLKHLKAIKGNNHE